MASSVTQGLIVSSAGLIVPPSWDLVGPTVSLVLKAVTTSDCPELLQAVGFKILSYKTALLPALAIGLSSLVCTWQHLGYIML